MHILFVCTGNICRSPTAERLAAAIGAQLQIPNFEASSAGTRAVVGHPIHHDAAVVLQGLGGGDGSGFSARQLAPRIISNADLILAMTIEHRNGVLEQAPHKLHRTFTLAEAAQLASDFHPASIEDLARLRPQLASEKVRDIPDPIGRNQQFFEMVGSRIAELLPPVLALCQQAACRSAAE
ncbi:low molecular weight phosphatase family protein [Mycolicibacterium austroafricanum]|nr:low molecular weight phosphatase family protein [Mycolicibacterium austroafricanum]QZT58440.1 low molecular weight phosphatase family protein [Mycolicibacterium austroafricanum]